MDPVRGIASSLHHPHETPPTPPRHTASFSCERAADQVGHAALIRHIPSSPSVRAKPPMVGVYAQSTGVYRIASYRRYTALYRHIPAFKSATGGQRSTARASVRVTLCVILFNGERGDAGPPGLTGCAGHGGWDAASARVWDECTRWRYTLGDGSRACAVKDVYVLARIYSSTHSQGGSSVYNTSRCSHHSVRTPWTCIDTRVERKSVHESTHKDSVPAPLIP